MTPRIELAGLGIGDGWMSPYHNARYGNFLYQVLCFQKKKQLSIHSVDSVNAHIYMQYRAIFTGKKLDISSNICTSHCKSAENVKYS